VLEGVLLLLVPPLLPRPLSLCLRGFLDSPLLLVLLGAHAVGLPFLPLLLLLCPQSASLLLFSLKHVQKGL
jgi:hypothetical protein